MARVDAFLLGKIGASTRSSCCGALFLAQPSAFHIFPLPMARVGYPTLQFDAPPANASPSRISQTDQAQAQCIELSIANSCGRGNAQVIECPHPGWRACSRSSGEAYADELGMVALRLCRFAGSSARTKLALLACQLPFTNTYGDPCCRGRNARSSGSTSSSVRYSRTR